MTFLDSQHLPALTEKKTSQDLEGSGDIKGGFDICGETWTSISSSHAMSSRIWNLS